MQDDFDQMIRPLLQPEDGDVLQVLYLRLSNGAILPFIGAPMAEEDWEKIEGIGRGEFVQIEGADDFDFDFDEPPRNTKRCYQ